jgi:hypothetical protein
MDIILDPPRAAGPIGIGMPFVEAELVLHSLEGYRPPASGVRVNAGFADFDSGLSASLGRGQDGNVETVEVYKPGRDVAVFFRGISIFDIPAEEVIRQLSEIAAIQVEDDGMRVLAPELVLSLWRSVLPDGPDDEDGRYFEAVLVAAPGYYDRSAEPRSADDSSAKRTSGSSNDGQAFLF